MQKGESPTIYGDGEQSRDFTYVQNVVEANLQACEKNVAEFSGEVFNIAYGKRVTLNELVKKINRIIKKDIKPIYSNPRPGDVKHSLANVGKARQFLEYDPQINFDNGLRKTIENMELGE